MIRPMGLAFLFVMLFLFPGCQTYTTGLQQTVDRADETAALAALRTIALAERTYGLTNSGEYGSLKQLVSGGFLDARYDGDKPVRDYVITLKVTPRMPDAVEGTYTCNADPDMNGKKAGRHLYIDSSSNGIHVNDTVPATAADKVIE